MSVPPGCLSDELGLDQIDGTPPGPVAVCLPAWTGDSFKDVAAVLHNEAISNAEDAFAALIRGLDPAHRQRGYDSLIPNEWGGSIVVSRLDPGRILVDISDAVFDINGISTLANGDIFLIQIFGTAFSDPTVNSVAVTAGGDPDALCGFLQREGGCGEMTRGDFFDLAGA